MPISQGDRAPWIHSRPTGTLTGTLTGTGRSRHRWQLSCAQGQAAAPPTAVWTTCPPSHQSSQRCRRNAFPQSSPHQVFRSTLPWAWVWAWGGDAVPLTTKVQWGAQSALGQDYKEPTHRLGSLSMCEKKGFLAKLLLRVKEQSWVVENILFRNICRGHFACKRPCGS